MFCVCVHHPLARSHSIDPNLEEIPLKEREKGNQYSRTLINRTFVIRMFAQAVHNTENENVHTEVTTEVCLCSSLDCISNNSLGN